ncbi:MAG TPA: class I SAM-dependent methyltransferase [Bacteroidetes bacterium]|nr:class I SAM-dependent methyltransferase [Bacteroidota bacterium]
MKAFWNNRYRDEEFAYGEAPNVFFKQELDQLTGGSILLPADGEGRNGIYAAVNNWEVSSCDLSLEGKNKALQSAKKQGVSLKYEVGDFGQLKYEPASFDAIALIFAHFPADKKSDYHRLLCNYLKVGGHIIFEAFGKNHLAYNAANPKVGGPKSLEMLFSTEELKNDFCDFEIIKLEEVETNLSEGLFHKGKGSVVRFVGRKKEDFC